MMDYVGDVGNEDILSLWGWNYFLATQAPDVMGFLNACLLIFNKFGANNWGI